jgi:hypothetical protein
VTDDPGSLLTDFQIDVAQLFFSLPASGGFLLAGGGALLAQGLTARPTQDLDFFTRPDRRRCWAGQGPVPRSSQ